MPRDERGWRVAPAPDGRGMPDPPAARPPHRTRGFVIFVVVLLALNWGLVLLFSHNGQTRVKVPFSPYFVSQVSAGQVASIASKGNTIQGTFKVAMRYPATDQKATPTTLFATEVPTFWNNDQLTALLQSHGVQINARSTVKTHIPARRAAVGLRPDLADRRAVRSVRPAGGEGRGDGRAG